MKSLALGLFLGFLLGVGVARLTAAPSPSMPSGAFLPAQLPQAPEGACEPQVYLFLNGEFFRLLPTPGGEPQELFPVEPAPNPFGGS